MDQKKASKHQCINASMQKVPTRLMAQNLPALQHNPEIGQSLL
jgi:hypothetical protein